MPRFCLQCQGNCEFPGAEFHVCSCCLCWPMLEGVGIGSILGVGEIYLVWYEHSVGNGVTTDAYGSLLRCRPLVCAHTVMHAEMVVESTTNGDRCVVMGRIRLLRDLGEYDTVAAQAVSYKSEDGSQRAVANRNDVIMGLRGVPIEEGRATLARI